MDLKPSEVATVLKAEIDGFQGKMQKSNVGTVLMVGDGTARVHGLDDCMMNEMLDFGGGIFGVALNLEEDNVGAVLLGSDSQVKEGDTVRTTGRIISVPTGLQMCGRVVDSLGRAVDGKGDIKVEDSDYRSIEGRSPSVPERQPVTEPLQTGIKAIDAMIPIGRGQRELIIGDRQTGKTALILDTFINQKQTGGGDPNNKDQVICIYVAVGQKQSTVKGVVQSRGYTRQALKTAEQFRGWTQDTNLASGVGDRDHAPPPPPRDHRKDGTLTEDARRSGRHGRRL